MKLKNHLYTCANPTALLIGILAVSLNAALLPSVSHSLLALQDGTVYAPAHTLWYSRADRGPQGHLLEGKSCIVVFT